MRYIGKYCSILMIGTVLLAALLMGTQANTGVSGTTRTGSQDNANNTLNLTIDVLIDFGSTRYHWAEVNLTGGNQSAFNATKLACDMLEFELNFSTSQWGIFINGIDAVFNADDWSESWSFFIWNTTTGEWEISPVGADQYIPCANGSIAWLYDSWGDSPPVPTPLVNDPALIKTDVLIDFGNGTFLWEDVILEGTWGIQEQATASRSSDVTDVSGSKGEVTALTAFEKAAFELGLDLNIVNTSFSPYISGVGGVEGENMWFWAVLEFTNGSWQYAPVGAGNLSLREGVAVGLYHTVWGYPMPFANPTEPYPHFEKILPVFTNYSLEYLGNNTYGINLTVDSDYNLPREVSFYIGNQSHMMNQHPLDIHWWTAEVKVQENFTYHFNSSLGIASVSTAAVESSPGSRDLWLDRKNAGELGSEEPSNNTGKEVVVEVEPGEVEVIYLENPTGHERARISVMGNGTLVARAMDWEEARKKTGDIGAGFNHMGFFMEIILGELEYMNIEIPYDPADLPPGADEENLALYLWNTTSDKWERVPDSGVDLDKKFVWANVTHLTIFAPMSTSRDLAGKNGEGESNLYIIIVLSVVIALVIIFLAIFIWKKGRSEGDEKKEEHPDEQGGFTEPQPEGCLRNKVGARKD